MLPIRIKACSESDLRMLGNLARNIQRVLPVTQADIDAAAALGKGWVVWKVIEVNDPIDNLRGGTQLVIKQNSITPGQNVRRVLIVSGPGGETVVIGPGPSPLLLPNAVANSLSYVKAFGGIKQNGTPTPDAPIDITSNNGVLKASVNEFDANAITNGYFYNENLVWVANASVYTTDYMKTVKGKYTLVLGNVTTLSITVNVRVNLFNANKEIQSQVVIPITRDTTEYTYEVDIPNGISYVRISTNPSYVVVSSFSNSKPVYTDGVVETINVHGKNLFNKDATPYLSGQFINNTTTVGGNIITTANSNYNVCRIPVSPSTNYTFGVIKAANPCWAVLDENGLVLQVGQHGAATVNSITVTTDATAKYLCLSVAVQGGYKCDDILQLEKGSTATTYEPYYDGGTATAEMLLSLGDYTDEQEIISGVVTRKLGVKVLDGTETGWAMGSSSFYISNLVPDAIGYSEDNPASIFSHFQGVQPKVSIADMPDGSAKLGASSQQRRLYFKNNAITSVSDWTDWLANQYAAGTPVIIVYPLATETTDTVTGQPMNTTAGDNILEITQASLNNLEMEAKYKQSK